jgi:cytolethal distending toxin subunit A
MARLRRAAAHAVASIVFALATFCIFGGASQAAAIGAEVMLVNVQTGKCLTIAGGESADNNVDSVQFNCDSHPSRRWILNQVAGNDIYQIRNVRTGKCLTIAGGRTTENNVTALQYDCDGDPSRTWRITDVGGNGLHQIRNVQTDKCLTIAGGRSTENNVTGLQYNCDADPSRRWILRLKLQRPGE